MAHIVAVANAKGGVGKSTLAVNLAVESVLAGHKTLLVDADTQGSAIQFLTVRDDDRPSIEAFQLTRDILHKQLPKVSRPYDYVFIDVGGRDSLVFRSALVASRTILIPMVPSTFDTWASDDVFEVISELSADSVRRRAMVVLNMVTHTVIARESEERVRSYLGDYDTRLLETRIHTRTAWPRSIGEGLGVTEWQPRCKAADELRQLVEELGIQT